jgi:hypothetical protein
MVCRGGTQLLHMRQPLPLSASKRTWLTEHRSSHFDPQQTFPFVGPVAGERGELLFEPRQRDLVPWSDSSDEIPLAEFNTAVPQDVVGGGAVEIKVGQHEMHQIGLAFETHRVFTKG